MEESEHMEVDVKNEPDLDVICIDDDNDFYEVDSSEALMENRSVQNVTSETNKPLVNELYRRCAYCYEKVSFKDTIMCPKNYWMRQQWAEALGIQFQSYIARYNKYPAVCRKHFVPSDFKNGKRIFARLPHRNEIYEGKDFEQCHRLWKGNFYGGSRAQYYTCDYCNTRRPRSDFRMVPFSLVSRELWARKLGEEFRKNIENKVSPLVCRSHFNQGVDLRSSYYLFSELPMTLEESEKVRKRNEIVATKNELETKCVYCYSDGNFDKMVRIPDKNHIQSWIDILGDRFALDVRRMPFQYICSSHFEEDPENPGMKVLTADKLIAEAEKREKIRKKAVPKIINFTCVYCNEVKDRKVLTTVTAKGEQMDQWCDILGIEFEFSVFNKAVPLICKSHFDPGALTPTGRVKDSSMPFPDDCPKRWKSRFPIPQTLTCAFCNKTGKLRTMRKVLHSQLESFSSILGREFEENCKKSKYPAICQSHFIYRLSPKSRIPRYGNLPHLLSEEENIIGESPLHSAIQVLDEAYREEDSKSDILKGVYYYDNEEKLGIREEEEQKRVVVAAKIMQATAFKLQKRKAVHQYGILLTPEEEMIEMYDFGYDSVKDMAQYHFHVMTGIDKPTNVEKMNVPARKCMYCGGSAYSMTEFQQEYDARSFDRYVEVFGAQFGVRLKSLYDSDKIPNVQRWFLCSRHLAYVNKPIPDKYRYYTADELLDHDYTDFSLR